MKLFHGTCRSRITKSSPGFTLIELLVAVGMFSILGTIIAQNLYTILLSRSKQQSIETSASGIRTIYKTITDSLTESRSVAVPNPYTVKVTATVCRTIWWDSVNGVIRQKTDPTSPVCAPPSPSSADPSITPAGVTITGFAVSPTSNGTYGVTLTGSSTDQFGDHVFDYQTSVTPRVTM